MQLLAPFLHEVAQFGVGLVGGEPRDGFALLAVLEQGQVARFLPRVVLLQSLHVFHELGGILGDQPVLPLEALLDFGSHVEDERGDLASPVFEFEHLQLLLHDDKQIDDLLLRGLGQHQQIGRDQLRDGDLVEEGDEAVLHPLLVLLVGVAVPQEELDEVAGVAEDGGFGGEQQFDGLQHLGDDVLVFAAEPLVGQIINSLFALLFDSVLF